MDIKSRSHGIILLFTDLSQYPLSLCMIPGNLVFVAFPFSTRSSILQKNHLISCEIVLRGIKRYWRAQQLSDRDDDRDEKIEKTCQIFCHFFPLHLVLTAGKKGRKFHTFCEEQLKFFPKTLQERQKHNSRSARLNIRFYPAHLPRHRQMKTGYR